MNLLLLFKVLLFFTSHFLISHKQPIPLTKEVVLHLSEIHENDRVINFAKLTEEDWDLLYYYQKNDYPYNAYDFIDLVKKDSTLRLKPDMNYIFLMKGSDVVKVYELNSIQMMPEISFVLFKEDVVFRIETDENEVIRLFQVKQLPYFVRGISTSNQEPFGMGGMDDTKVDEISIGVNSKPISIITDKTVIAKQIDSIFVNGAYKRMWSLVSCDAGQNRFNIKGEIFFDNGDEYFITDEYSFIRKVGNVNGDNFKLLQELFEGSITLLEETREHLPLSFKFKNAVRGRILSGYDSLEDYENFDVLSVNLQQTKLPGVVYLVYKHGVFHSALFDYCLND